MYPQFVTKLTTVIALACIGFSIGCGPAPGALSIYSNKQNLVDRAQKINNRLEDAGFQTRYVFGALIQGNGVRSPYVLVKHRNDPNDTWRTAKKGVGSEDSVDFQPLISGAKAERIMDTYDRYADMAEARVCMMLRKNFEKSFDSGSGGQNKMDVVIRYKDDGFWKVARRF